MTPICVQKMVMTRQTSFPTMVGALTLIAMVAYAECKQASTTLESVIEKDGGDRQNQAVLEKLENRRIPDSASSWPDAKVMWKDEILDVPHR